MFNFFYLFDARWGDGSKFTCKELKQCFKENYIGKGSRKKSYFKKEGGGGKGPAIKEKIYFKNFF